MASNLNARRLFSISGQFDITNIINDEEGARKNPFVYADVKCGDCYSNFLRFYNDNFFVYYLYPAMCNQDFVQSQKIKMYRNIFSFPFKSKNHGVACFGFNYPYIFLLSDLILQSIAIDNVNLTSDSYNPVYFSKYSFLKKTVDSSFGVYYLLVRYYLIKMINFIYRGINWLIFRFF